VTPPVPTPPPAEKSIEQLLKELEAVQAQKVQVLKTEADLKAAVQKKLEGIRKHADELGVGPGPGKAGAPERVGRIFVEGFAENRERAVVASLEKIGLRPGQVLRHPDLQDAQTWLEKSGFRGATVEALPTAPDSDPEFRDIRVRGAAEGDR
jgi:hypothetical protein